MLEIIVTLVIVGLLAGLAYGYSKNVFGSTTDLGSNLTLATIRTDFNQAAYSNANSYPANLTTVETPGASYITTTSTDPGHPSVHRIDDTSMVIAQRTENGACAYVYNSLDARARWGIAENSAEYCNAELISDDESVNSSTVSTDPLNPTKVELD